MRRSFGPKMGGGGGGGMMKTVQAVRAAAIGGAGATRTTTGNRNQPSLNTTLSLPPRPTSPCSYLNNPAVLDANRPFTTSSPATSEDWEYVDGGASDGDSVNGFYDDLLFGDVPSEQEVHHAVTSLHEVLEPVSFAQLMKKRETYLTGDDDARVEKISSPTGFQRSGFELDWHEQSMQLCYSTSALQVPNSDKVFDAFHMLQTDPSVQRMVISLSSDKAVWDAVMNNKVVRELRESIGEAKSVCDGSEAGIDEPNPVAQVLRWIFANTKDKVIEIVDKITKVVNELLQSMTKDEKPKRDANVGLDLFDEKLRSLFFSFHCGTLDCGFESSR